MQVLVNISLPVDGTDPAVASRRGRARCDNWAEAVLRASRDQRPSRGQHASRGRPLVEAGGQGPQRAYLATLRWDFRLSAPRAIVRPNS